MSSSDPFEDGLIYHADAPVSWRTLDTAREPDFETLNSANEQTLRLLAAVEEYFPESVDEHGQSHEAARLELKLNLLLELVGELLAAQRSLPAPRPIRLNARGVEWHQAGGDVPQPDQRLAVDLYLSTEVPRPLRLLVAVVQVQAAADEAIVTAAIEPMSESVVDLLEKFIFRRHRRSIAHSRPKTRPQAD